MPTTVTIWVEGDDPDTMIAQAIEKARELFPAPSAGATEAESVRGYELTIAEDHYFPTDGAYADLHPPWTLRATIEATPHLGF